jgi:hypothetical protein
VIRFRWNIRVMREGELVELVRPLASGGIAAATASSLLLRRSQSPQCADRHEIAGALNGSWAHRWVALLRTIAGLDMRPSARPSSPCTDTDSPDD